MVLSNCLATISTLRIQLRAKSIIRKLTYSSRPSSLDPHFLSRQSHKRNMSYPSYPPPKSSELHPSVEITPRSLKPLLTPPLPNTLPPLPSAPRNPSFASNYTLTTHLYPSAYPHTPSTPLPRSAYADLVRNQ
ncbi:hypothetical protein M422DRAFT_248927 [Sphaerobolus stellatus SS14]|nr:hypothetical protein M422DRAFT_248927 [Sphaerobolus stellatus SS14]